MAIKLIAVLIAGAVAAAAFSGCKAVPSKEAVNAEITDADGIAYETRISVAEWADIEWEEFSCECFTVSVPKGWNVTWNSENNILSWRASRPNSISYVSYTEQDTAAKSSEEMKKYAVHSYMEKGSVEEYFENMYNCGYELKYPASGSFFRAVEFVPISDNDKVCRELPQGRLRDSSAIFGEFSENNILGEGAYSAAVFSTDSSLWTIRHIILGRAPKGELTNWIPIYNRIFDSFQYTDSYKSTRKSEDTDYLPDVCDTAPLNAAASSRPLEDVIQQEKHSDIVGGYERVYDTETNAIYRAYIGFIDDQGTDRRYVPITREQYANGYSGWITKQR